MTSVPNAAISMRHKIAPAQTSGDKHQETVAAFETPLHLSTDYVQIVKYACRRVFKRTPSIITKCAGREGSIYFYSSLLILPDGTRFVSQWSYATIFATENALCFAALMSDSRLALDKENAYRWEKDDFVRATQHIRALRAAPTPPTTTTNNARGKKKF